MKVSQARDLAHQTTSDAPTPLGVNPERADYLFETIVCGAYESAIQVAAFAILSHEFSRSGAAGPLRSFRHLLVDDSKVMLFALTYGEDIGLKHAVVAQLAGLYREIAAAKSRLALQIGSMSAGSSNREAAQKAAQSWRRLAEETSKAIGSLCEAARTRLNEVYQHDGRAVRQFLQQAAAGDRSLFDSAGALRFPELRQRRRLPRFATKKPCTLVLQTGARPARLEDVSLQGLALVCDAPVKIGETVSVELPDGRKLSATVARRQGERIGLRLAASLSPSDPLFAEGAGDA